MKMTSWRLKKGMDRRFRTGHPWVYSNELQESPKGHGPGELVKLHDSGGKFLALGFGNPSSLIAFRTITRNPEELEPTKAPYLLRALSQALLARKQMGFGNASFRLCFGEADGIPGLVIDRYLTLAGHQILVLQAHTAGADTLIGSGELLIALEALCRDLGIAWIQTAVVLRNDLSIRTLEGLKEQEPTIIRKGSFGDLNHTTILARRASASPSGAQDPLEFTTDLLAGQKTGFFLDQWANIELAARRLLPAQGTLKILDLCSYVGQWGVQLGSQATQNNRSVHVTVVDASAKALEFASINLERAKLDHQAIKGDILKDLGRFENRSFDLVIADPPALIKSKKDIGSGSHAYAQIAGEALRLTRSGVVLCSCSRLLTEQAFEEAILKGSRKSGLLPEGITPRWIAKGAQSPDHPMLMEFPEGRYLKSWFGLVPTQRT